MYSIEKMHNILNLYITEHKLINVYTSKYVPKVNSLHLALSGSTDEFTCVAVLHFVSVKTYRLSIHSLNFALKTDT